MTSETERDLERQLRMTHERFVTAMSARIPAMSLEQRERYFAVLSSLVAKLEDRDKPLRDILQEMVAEAGPYLFRELGSGGW
jgi:hypothetical protein